MSRKRKRFGKRVKPRVSSIEGDTVNAVKGLDEGYTVATSNQNKSEKSDVCKKKRRKKRGKQNASSIDNHDILNGSGFEPSKEVHKRRRQRRKKNVRGSKNGVSVPDDVHKSVTDLHVTKGLDEAYTVPTSNQDPFEDTEVCKKKSVRRRKKQNTSSANNQDILSGLVMSQLTRTEPLKDGHQKIRGCRKKHIRRSKNGGNVTADVDENVTDMHVTKDKDAVSEEIKKNKQRAGKYCIESSIVPFPATDGEMPSIEGTWGKGSKCLQMKKVEEQLQEKENVQVIAKGDEHSQGYLGVEANEQLVENESSKVEVKLNGEAELLENEVVRGKVQLEGEAEDKGLDNEYVIRRENLCLHVDSHSIDQNDCLCDSCYVRDLSVGMLSPKRSNRKLLILDLNGLLADIVFTPHPGYKADKKVKGKAVFKRPFCEDFLQFCFEKFDVAVWSSRRKDNVDIVVDCLLGDLKNKLLFCWDQSKCTTTGFFTLENRHKPLVLKELKKVWDKEEPDLPWVKGYYNPSNTLLLDDSPYKALCNPPYTAVFPLSYTFKDKKDSGLGRGGDLRVYLEELVEVEDVRCYVQEHPFGQRPITKANPSWPFYLRVIEFLNSKLITKP